MLPTPEWVSDLTLPVLLAAQTFTFKDARLSAGARGLLARNETKDGQED